MAASSPLFFLLSFILYGGLEPPQVRAQQPYGKEINDCNTQHNSTGMLGYFCGGVGSAPSCPAFLTFTSRAPYSSLASIAALLSADVATLAWVNEVGDPAAPLADGTRVLVPATCGCTATPEGRFYQRNATWYVLSNGDTLLLPAIGTSYAVKNGDTLLIIAAGTFQGLTSCQALQAQGLRGASPETLQVGQPVSVPLRCACPTTAQAAAGAKFLVSYLVVDFDNVTAVAARFGVDAETVIAANQLEPLYSIIPSTTLLVPVSAQPNVSRIQTPPSTRQDQNRRISKVLVIALVPLLGSFLCLASFLAIRRHKIGKGTCWGKAKTNVQENKALVWEPEGRTTEYRIYEFSQVVEATSNFSEENKLGQGGFGPVFRGRFPDGLEIAVKRLASHSGQGFTEFRNEVHLVAKLQHTNLVRLLGCCSEGEEKILIYEYLPNKSLDFFIFDETRRAILDWTKRLVIIEGIAQGLLYMHKHSRLRVIHRDLKASNILLDCDMNPKISDFGLAKIFNPNDNEGNTRRIAGTYGYMAPEYALGGIFSIKSDVFSFGVIIIEIVSGQKISDFHEYGGFMNLLGHAWQLWKDGLWLQLVDASLDAERHAPEMMRCINIALLCVQEKASDRPTMSDVVAMLSSETKTLAEPEHPAYFHVRVTAEEVSTVGVPCSVNNVTLSALDGR